MHESSFPDPRVLVLGPSDKHGQYGGYVSYVKSLTDSALSREFNSQLVDLFWAPRWPVLVRHSSGRLLSQTWKTVTDLAALMRMGSRYPSLQVVHCPIATSPQRQMEQVALLNLAHRRFGMKRIFDVRAGDFFTELSKAPALVRRAVTAMIREAEAVTVEGRPYMAPMREMRGHDPEYMPSFVEWGSTGARYRVEYHHDQPLKVCYGGQLNDDKGIFELIEAVSLLPGGSTSLELVGFCKDDMKARLLRAIGKVSGNEVSIHTNLAREDYLKRLAANDLFVFPSYHYTEGHSNALNEAMALGLPVVSTPVGFCEDVLAEGGLMIPPRDPGAIAGAIEELSGDPRRRERMGRANRNRVKTRFSDIVVMENWANLYRRLMGGAVPRQEQALKVQVGRT